MAASGARTAHCGNTRIMNQEENNEAVGGRSLRVSWVSFQSSQLRTPRWQSQDGNSHHLSILTISPQEQGKCCLPKHVYKFLWMTVCASVLNSATAWGQWVWVGWVISLVQDCLSTPALLIFYWSFSKKAQHVDSCIRSSRCFQEILFQGILNKLQEMDKTTKNWG